MDQKKAQSAFEFLIIISFMTLVFVSFFAVASSQFADAKEQKSHRIAEDIAGIVVNQVDLTSGLNNGYSSQFLIPQVVEGTPYALQVVDGREVVVIYQEYEYVAFLSQNITGNITFGQNTISKRDGRIYLNS